MSAKKAKLARQILSYKPDRLTEREYFQRVSKQEKKLVLDSEKKQVVEKIVDKIQIICDDKRRKYKILKNLLKKGENTNE